MNSEKYIGRGWMPFAVLTVVHVEPPSTDLISALGRASTSAYTTFGFDGEIATAIRPHGPGTIPSASVILRKVSPPSRVRYSPLPGPPDLKSYAVRRWSYIATNILSGLRGSTWMSATPVFWSTYSFRSQVRPMSVVL